MQRFIAYWPPAVKLSEGEEVILHLSRLCHLEMIMCSPLSEGYLTQFSQKIASVIREETCKRLLLCAEFYSLCPHKDFVRDIANLRISIQGVQEGRLKVDGEIRNGSGNFDMTYEQEPQTFSVWLQSVYIVTWRVCFPS